MAASDKNLSNPPSNGPAAPDNSSSSQTGKRLPKTTAFLPVAYGSVAFYLGKKADEYQTHQWTLFVRGPNNEDLSGVVSKVVFQLHASFAQPMREILAPPFEVTERGWGEFEAQIKIFWKERSEKPTLFNHGIKLYPAPAPGATPGTPLSADTGTPVVAEVYDEIVFTDPTEVFYQQMLRVSSMPTVSLKEDRVQGALSVFSDEANFQALLEAKKFLETELIGVREHFEQVEGEMSQLDRALRIAQEKNRTKRPQRGGGAAKKQKK